MAKTTPLCLLQEIRITRPLTHGRVLGKVDILGKMMGAQRVTVVYVKLQPENVAPSKSRFNPDCVMLNPDCVRFNPDCESLTLTAIALVPVLAMAFSLTVPGIVSDVATVTKGAGPWRSVNCSIVLL